MIEIDKNNHKTIEKLKEIKQNGFQTILLMWWVGVGKTFLARNIFGGYFIDEPQFKQEIVAGNARLRNPEEWNCSIDKFPLEALTKHKQVIYDDIGSVDCNETYIEKTLYWLNERAKKKTEKWNPFRTILTTNLTLDELEKREKRIFSRIMENCLIITLSWPDRREKNTKSIVL